MRHPNADALMELMTEILAAKPELDAEFDAAPNIPFTDAQIAGLLARLTAGGTRPKRDRRSARCIVLPYARHSAPLLTGMCALLNRRVPKGITLAVLQSAACFFAASGAYCFGQNALYAAASKAAACPESRTCTATTESSSIT